MNKTTLCTTLVTLLGLQSGAYAAPTVNIAGLVEVEAYHSEDAGDLSVTTVEVGLAAQVNEKVSAEVVLLHEGEETDFGVDTETVSLTISDHLRLTTGQTYVPFGVFGSYMISDPLTMELAETNATALQADYTTGPLSASLYTFNGVNADENIDNWGANLAYTSDHLLLTLGYLANLGDTDGIAADTIDNKVPGMSLSAGVNLGGFSLIGEYISALDEFQVGDGNSDPLDGYQFTTRALPSAGNLELAYAIEATTLAMGIQTTGEAEALGLPEKRIVAGVSHQVLENSVIALEWTGDEDYAGNSSDTVTARLAVTF